MAKQQPIRNNNNNPKSTPAQAPRTVEAAVLPTPLPFDPSPITGPLKAFFTNYKLQGLLVAICSMVIYLNTMTLHWAVDDAMVITRNTFTQRGAAGIPGIWKTDMFYGLFGESKNLVSGGRYRPFTMTMFALEVELFASDRKDAAGNIVYDYKDAMGIPLKSKQFNKTVAELQLLLNDPGLPPNTRAAINAEIEANRGYKLKELDPEKSSIYAICHLINVLLYGALAWCLYIWFLKMLNPERKEDNGMANFIAFTGAMIFAMHPIHTEAVANVKGRDEIVATLGSVLASYWLLRSYYDPANNRKYMIWAVSAFTIGLFSKESGVTFFAVIPFMFWCFTNAQIGTIISKTSVLIPPFIFFMWIRTSVLGVDGSSLGTISYELMNNPFLKFNPAMKTAPLYEGAKVNYITNPPGAYIRVTGMEQFAMTMATWGRYLKLLIFPHPLTNDYYPRHVEFMNMLHPEAFTGFLANAALIFAGIWGLLKRNIVGFGIMTYYATFSVVSNVVFPIGSNMSERFMFMPSLGLALVAGWCLWKLVALINKGKEAFNPAIVMGLIAVVCTLYGFKAWDRNYAWKNDFVLFTGDVKISVNSSKLNMATGGEILTNSEKVYQKDVKIANDKFTAEGSKDTATLNKAVRDAQTKRLKEVDYAMELLERSLLHHPGFANAWLLYGNAHIYKAKYDEAIRCYRQVEIWRPGHQDLNQNMAVALREMGRIKGEQQGKPEEAIKYLAESTSKYNPNDPEALRLLGTAYGLVADKTGNFAMHNQAINAFMRCYRLNPNNLNAIENMAIAYQKTGQGAKAIEAYELLNQKIPNNPVILQRLRDLCGQTGQAAKAAQYNQMLLSLSGGGK